MHGSTGSTGSAEGESVRRAADAAEQRRPGQEPGGELVARQRQLAESQQLAHVGSWEVADHPGCAVWSDELCRIFGQPVGFSPSYEGFLSLVHPDDAQSVREDLERARDGVQVETWYRIIRPDGELRHVHGRAYGRPGPDGELAYSFGTIQDVTERREAEHAWREAQELFETAFSHAPIGMALLAPDGRWLKVNPAACGITGRSEPDLLATSLRDITHPEDQDNDLVQLEMLLAGEISGYQVEKRYLTAQGGIVWALVSVSLVHDARGTPLHLPDRGHQPAQALRAPASAR